jgi:menaquinone-9 beta-reductase
MTAFLEPFGATADATWDAVVIGAGPAGALAARQLAEGGGRVLLLEKKRFPRWKVCGACLNGQALSVLESTGLGTLVARLGGVELKEFQARFRGRSARIALSVGAAVSRARLDAALVEAATDQGVRFLQETPAIVGGIREGARLVKLGHPGRTIEVGARVVLVAAGLGNSCREREATGRPRIESGSRVGAGCLVEDAPDFFGGGTIFMAVGREGYVGLVRVEDGSLNVAAAFDSELVRRLGTPGVAAAAIVAEAGFPPIVALEAAHWQGTARLTRRMEPLAEDRLFVLGDAAGYVEPITGEGIAWALASAQAIAPLALQAIERWDPRHGLAWADMHRRLVLHRQLVCRASAMALRKPWLTRLAFEVLTRAPGAAGLILQRLNAPPSFSKASSPCPC